MQTLTGEHDRIRSMLSCFEAQLDRFGRAERPDYEILEGSISYCQEYLDQWHHPREEALLDLLQRRAPTEAGGASGDLEDQHRGLARTTGALVKVFEAVEHDAAYLRETLVELGRTLLRDYRSHLDWEEANFFPVVMDNLLPEDWQEIAPHFAEGADPLTQNPVDQRYRALFSAIADL